MTARWLGALALLWLAGCARQAGPEVAVQSFFTLLAAGRTEEAYRSAAFGFQAQQSLEQFATTVREMKLAELDTVKLAPPEPDGRAVKVRAEFAGKDGPALALVVTLTEEARVWRVFALKSPRSAVTGLVEDRFSVVGKASGRVGAAHRQPAPEEAVVQALIAETMGDFEAAVRAGSFAELYVELAQAWQEQLTEARFQRAFQPFIDQHSDFAAVRTLSPVLDGPAQLSSDGLLIVSGHYPMKPYRVVFTLKYFYELPKWKLFGLDVSQAE